MRLPSSIFFEEFCENKISLVSYLCFFIVFYAKKLNFNSVFVLTR
ncbi:hypothetical protein AvCA_22110 [Azotobacter vinelandii CA]|uniref:Uncharacterized protein n=2 Tax=Azotobacter vinelandii TaxID=354 RepID=C1DG91_AZOVD|nr:hypothetical protein Avin_22110 [Azotobacter vinelandii DJ]AGK15029.1 hypothetical protein AvCA_22110 [Azotobacter vinelandii CA]AGK20480.1 hypothetical protein AvCA6_22110 [Azotobacter vinelandii CA6]